MTMGYLVVGATGFLGKRTFKRLLATGSPVIALVRTRRGQSAQARLDALVAAVGARPAIAPTVIDLDVSEPGIAPVLADALAALTPRLGIRDLVVVNLAASLKMDFPGQNPDSAARIRDLNQRTNVQGLASLAQALDRWEATVAGSRVVHFVQFSTAYTHGGARGLLSESHIPSEVPTNNSYEATKRAGEHGLEAWHARRADRTRLTIIRPSIVTGPDTPDGLGAFLDLLCESMDASRMPGWLLRFLRLEPRSHRLVDVIRAIGLRLPLPVPMLGNRDSLLDLIDVDDVDRYSWLAIRDDRGPADVPAPLYLHLTHPGSMTLQAMSRTVLSAAGASELAPRLRVFRAFNFFMGLLMVIGALPFAGPAIRNIFKRTQMLRPYLMRHEQTEFATDHTNSYFVRVHGGLRYEPRAIDLAYLASLIATKSDLARVPAPAADPLSAGEPLAT